MVAPGEAVPSEPTPGPIARALWAGALAGLAVGAGDALLSWRWLASFLPGAADRLRCALFSAGLYALVLGPLAAAVTAIGLVLLRGTALGPLLAHARDQHTRARGDDPRRALVGLALALAAIPCLGAGLLAAYAIGVETVERRHHAGLIVAVILGTTLGLLAIAVLATFVLGRLVELGLAALPRRALRALSHPLAPPLTAVGLVALAAAVAGLAARKVLADLALRPYFGTCARPGCGPRRTRRWWRSRSSSPSSSAPPTRCARAPRATPGSARRSSRSCPASATAPPTRTSSRAAGTRRWPTTPPSCRCRRRCRPTSTCCWSPSTPCAPTTSRATATAVRPRPPSTPSPRAGPGSRTPGPTPRRRATRCRPSSPAATRRRSRGTPASGGRRCAPRTTPSPRSCTSAASRPRRC